MTYLMFSIERYLWITYIDCSWNILRRQINTNKSMSCVQFVTVVRLSIRFEIFIFFWLFSSVQIESSSGFYCCCCCHEEIIRYSQRHVKKIVFRIRKWISYQSKSLSKSLFKSHWPYSFSNFWNVIYIWLVHFYILCIEGPILIQLKCFTICHIVLIWSIDTNLNRNQCFLFDSLHFISPFFYN